MNTKDAARGQTQIELIRCIDVKWLGSCLPVAKELIRTTSEAPVLRVRPQEASTVGDKLGVLPMNE